MLAYLCDAEGVDLLLALEIVVLLSSCSVSESVSSSKFLLFEAAACIEGFAFLLLLDLDIDMIVNGVMKNNENECGFGDM